MREKIGLNFFLFVILICIFTDLGGYIFGKVIKGMEFVDKIKRGDENNNGAVSDPDKIISFKSQ